MFTGGESDAVGTGTVLVQEGAVKVTIVALAGGIGLLSEEKSIYLN